MPETKDIFLDSISSTPSERPSGVNHLLVIAIDAYKHCPPLKSCVKDAKDFIQVLWEKYTFEKSHTYTLINEQATRANILNTIKQLRNKVKEKESLVIYYSGHGYIADDMGYWIPVDAASDDEVGFVSGADLKQRLDKINSFHTFLIVDACFSGALFLSFKNGVALTAAGEDKRSRWGLAASHSREKALDGTTGDNSPFAKELLRNLRVNAENLSVLNLGSRITDEVYKNSEQKQAPVFERLNIRGDDSGQFVFHLKPEYKESQAWKGALENNQLSDFIGFIGKFPKSQYAALANQKITDLYQSIGDENAWQYAKNEHSEIGCQRYIECFPQGLHVAKAREYLAEIRQKHQQSSKKEEGARNITRRARIVIDVKAFLRDFSLGSYKWILLAFLTLFSFIAVVKILYSYKEAKEKEAFDHAYSTKTISAWTSFLETFPEGVHAQEAQEQLQDLHKEAEEKKAFDHAYSVNTIPAWTSFLEKFPEGVYKQEAQEQLKVLNKDLEALIHTAGLFIENKLFNEAYDHLQDAKNLKPEDPRIGNLLQKLE